MQLSPHPEIPELLDQYMEDSGRSEQWITVQEIRAYFNLTESDGPVISGFLRKIHHWPFFSCRYKVARIEKFQDTTSPYRIIRKYLVGERPVQRGHPVNPVNKLYSSGYIGIIRSRKGQRMKPLKSRSAPAGEDPSSSAPQP